jgi:hypothetical protein
VVQNDEAWHLSLARTLFLTLYICTHTHATFRQVRMSMRASSRLLCSSHVSTGMAALSLAASMCTRREKRDTERHAAERERVCGGSLSVLDTQYISTERQLALSGARDHTRTHVHTYTHTHNTNVHTHRHTDTHAHTHAPRHTGVASRDLHDPSPLPIRQGLQKPVEESCWREVVGVGEGLVLDTAWLLAEPPEDLSLVGVLGACPIQDLSRTDTRPTMALTHETTKHSLDATCSRRKRCRGKILSRQTKLRMNGAPRGSIRGRCWSACLPVQEVQYTTVAPCTRLLPLLAKPSMVSGYQFFGLSRSDLRTF